MIMLVTGVLGVLAVVAVFANHRYHWVAGWRYDWARAKHLVHEVERANGPDQGFYGSMNLADEPFTLLAAYPPPDEWMDAGMTGPDWREQTAAALSPGALEEVMPHADLAAPVDPRPHVSPGPGGLSSLTPGPGPGHIHNGSCSDDRCWNGGPGRRADLERLADTGDIASARLLAEVQAELRAMDDDCAAYRSALVAECARVRVDLAAALA